VNVTKGLPGANAIASFSGTSGQQISATFTNAKAFKGCPSYRLLLERPDGSTLSEIDACNTDNANLQVSTLDANGTKGTNA
jgi:hypothetical protein